MTKYILIVDDEPDMLRAIEMNLKSENYNLITALNAEEALEKMAAMPVDLVLTDLVLPGMDGIALLREIKSLYPGIPTIIITGLGTIQSAVEAIKEGAYDFITKPFQYEELKITIEKALEYERLTKRVYYLEEQANRRYNFKNIIGISPAMKELFRQLRKVVSSSATVLIQGESGTGKELLARAIHQNSPVSRGPFVPVDCSTLSETLLESELFGHVRGAFTGAWRSRKGLFEASDGGTLFLDEVSNIPLETQAKLLRVLQEREIKPVGSTEPIKLDVRIIAATNQDLRQQVRENKFRKDLYFRLAVVPLFIPPLRHRREDIPLLANHFLYQFATSHKKNIKGIDPEAMEKLMAYHWPGNVRELENVMERAVLMADGPVLGKESFLLDLVSTPEDEDYSPGIEPLKEVIRKAEQRTLEKALKLTNGNREEAAKLLGVSRRNLYYKLSRYGLG